MPISYKALSLIILHLLFYCNPVRTTSLYVLRDSYEGPSFFDDFDFFTQSDPTHGFVRYVDETTARNTGLISSAANKTYIGVDHTNTYPVTSPGRPSVRIQSKKSYNHGLFLADIAHMPGGVCGTWPAFWTVGPDWPNNGEIDMIESANQATENLISLHTSENCTVAGSGQTGILVTNDCFVDAVGQPINSGCGMTSAYGEPYGTAFNNGQGGVYAMEWTSKAIKIWFFARNSIPASISAGAPDPTKFGTPTANFQGSCEIDSHIAHQKIVIDTTFCGDYAGNVWTSGSCARKAATCVDYVANNPNAFTDAFWSIKSVKVYQLLVTTASSSSSYLSSVTPLVSTSSISSVPVGMGRTSTSSNEALETSSSGALLTASSKISNSTLLGASSTSSSIASSVSTSSLGSIFTAPGLPTNLSVFTTVGSAVTATSAGAPNRSTGSFTRKVLLKPIVLTTNATAKAALETSTIRLCRGRKYAQSQPVRVPLEP